MSMFISFLLLVGGLIGMAILAKKAEIKRNGDDFFIAGVCAGIAKKFGIQPIVVRAGFVLSVLIFGFGIIPYIILWIILEKEE